MRNSEAVGLTADELQTARAAGQILADIAPAQGVSTDTVVAAIAECDLTQAEADGRLAAAEERKENLTGAQSEIAELGTVVDEVVLLATDDGAAAVAMTDLDLADVVTDAVATFCRRTGRTVTDGPPVQPTARRWASTPESASLGTCTIDDWAGPLSKSASSASAR